MAQIGLNVRRDGSDDPALIRSLNATWIRIVATPEHDLGDYFTRCRAAGLRILLVLARESGGNIALYRQRYAGLVDLIQAGNEPDITSPASWTMTPVELASFGRSVRAIFPDVPLVCAGMASGHPEWMAGMDLSWADACAVQPYLKDAPNPGDLEDLPDLDVLVRAYHQFGKPVLVTEWGWWGSEERRAVEEVDDAVSWAAKTTDCAMFFYFALGDDVPPFGLLRPNGSEKARAAAFRDKAKDAVSTGWPTPADEGEEAPAVATIYEEFCRSEAQRRGITPDVAVIVANAEGGLTEPARVGKFATGWSFWAFQLHYGGAGYEHYGTVAGMGNEFTRRTGWHPGAPDAWRDAMRYALDAARAGGWGPWYGAKAKGVTGFYGIDRAVPWSGTPAGEWDYQRVTSIPFIPNAPIDQQPDDWSCSIQAAQWFLRSIGRNPDASDPTGDPWLRSKLVPGIVSPDVGLRDATGSALAAWLTREYGAEMGFVAHAAPVNFEDVRAGAGVNPTLIGGRGWNHWAGVRGVNPDGTLAIANSARGFKGVGDSLSREQWNQLGPFSAIWIDRMAHLPVPAPEPPPPAPSRAAVLISEIEERLAELKRLVA